MKIRSTVFWPEKDVVCNQIVDLPDDEAKARIDAGFAVAHVEGEPEPAPAQENSGSPDSSAPQA